MTMTPPANSWFSVRCVFEIQPANHQAGELRTYEERVTLWQADSLDDAIALAEEEAQQYERRFDVHDRYLGLAQAFEIADEPGHGVEIFSLLRDSELSPATYLDTYFDTGTEYQQSTDSNPTDPAEDP
jgi:hypothetical protein